MLVWTAEGSIEGSPGSSAYEVAVGNGFVGTVAEWLTSLHGADGGGGVGGDLTGDVTSVGPVTTIEGLSTDKTVDGTTSKAFLATERTKLAGIAAGATANSPDATLLDRANHTGTQVAATVSDFDAAADARIDAAGLVTAVAGRSGAVVLTKTDVGLENADDTADTAKPVSTAQQAALDLKANLASPPFTGVPTAPTAAPGTSTDQLATTAFVAALPSGKNVAARTYMQTNFR